MTAATRALSIAILIAVSALARAQTLNPTADTYVDSSLPTSNFALANPLLVMTHSSITRDAYMKFDTSSILSVKTAILRLAVAKTQGGGGLQTVNVHAVADTSWTESGTTWNNRPSIGSALGSFGTGASLAWREIDVTAYVQAEKLAGRNVIAFAIHGAPQDSQFRSITVQSREDATNRPQLVIVANAVPTVSLTAPVNGAVFLPGAGVTATANAADSDGTIAKVEFFDGATLAATVTSAPYTTTLNNLSVGTHSLTAKATDNLGASTVSSAVSVRVNAAPTVSLTSPANGTVFTAPASFTLSATVADFDGTVTKVDFFRGATLVGTSTSAPYSASVTNLAGGNYSFTAVATDNDNGQTTSAPVAVTVNAPPVAALHFIEVDHLNTPRAIYDTNDQLKWRWDQAEPFGVNAPDENPSNLGAFEFPVRFAGQYADKETNLSYNYFRTYDQTVGRYIESDLVGLRGGLNTYAYVDDQPTGYTDPKGLQASSRTQAMQRNQAIRNIREFNENLARQREEQARREESSRDNEPGRRENEQRTEAQQEVDLMIKKWLEKRDLQDFKNFVEELGKFPASQGSIYIPAVNSANGCYPPRTHSGPFVGPR